MWRVARLAGLVTTAALACSDAPERAAGDDVLVRVGSVGVDRFNSPVVVLEEQDGPRILPIWIGPAEASSIAAHIHNQPPPRPNFHDLAKRVIQSVHAEVLRVVITEIRDGTYYAKLVLRSNGQAIEIDVRPSDGIAVAVRLDAPILVREVLFEQAEADDRLPADESGESVSFGPPDGAQPAGRARATPGLEL